MSGIAGIIRFDGGPVEPGLVERMTGAMSYRGPDGIHHWTKGSVALGHCMLRTTPESLEETQPLANEDESLVLVMDGWLSNWEELRHELLARGATLRTRADAELVLRAYEQWGRDCLGHIDGDFAFVIWDARQRSAFCARDRIGNKPFHYHWNGATLSFASDLHPVLALPWVPEVANEGIIAEHLSNQWFSHTETLWRDVLRLRKAHFMSVDSDGLATHEYWRPDYSLQQKLESEADLAASYREVLFDTVRRYSRSHTPVACEVSGGLDSSAIFAVAESLRSEERLIAPGLRGYGLAFPGDEKADEIAFMRAVGRHCKSEVQEIAPTYKPNAWYRDRARELRDFPGLPNGTMSLDLRQAARQHGSSVILSGTGGDEWLGTMADGYYYAEEIAGRNWALLARLVAADRASMGFISTVWWVARFGLGPNLPRWLKSGLRSFRRSGSRCDWLAPELQSVLDQRKSHASMATPTFSRFTQQWQHQLLNYAYSSLARELEERMCAQVGLDWRTPLNSRTIVEWAISLPERFRSRGRTTKWLHRRAMVGLLPDLVVDRQTKADFSTTFRQQFQSAGKGDLIDVANRRHTWVQPEAIAAAFNDLRPPRSSQPSDWVLWFLVGCDAVVEGGGTENARYGNALPGATQPRRASAAIQPLEAD
jgi:asparagine synthase (glutamine-hydrolysing)